MLPDTPAEQAGIEEGDLIVAVDGESIAGVSSEVSTAQIKGPPRTEVELRVEPAAGGEARELTVERAEVRVPAVDGEIRSGRRRARSPTCASSPSARAPTASCATTIERLYRRGAEGLVLDLRGNGGGLLNEAVLSASRSSSRRARRLDREPHPGRAQTTRPSATRSTRGPTVVLVNRDTASAAEILAAALEDNDLATVVGTRTYGKGTFQEVIELEAGGALDLTIGEYLTADGDLDPRRGGQARRRGVDDDPQDRRARRGAREPRRAAGRRATRAVSRGARRGRCVVGRAGALRWSPSRCSSAARRSALAGGSVASAAGRDGPRRVARRGGQARRDARLAPTAPATWSSALLADRGLERGFDADARGRRRRRRRRAAERDSASSAAT